MTNDKFITSTYLRSIERISALRPQRIINLSLALVMVVMVVSLGYTRFMFQIDLESLQLSNAITTVNLNQLNQSPSQNMNDFALNLCKIAFPFQVINTSPTPLTIFFHPVAADVFVSKSVPDSKGDPSKLFEAEIRNQMLNVLSQTKDPLILDIGANIGLHTLFFSHAGYRVHAFEPLKKNYQLLQCSILANQLFHSSQLNAFGFSSQPSELCMKPSRDVVGINLGGTFVSGGTDCAPEDLASFQRFDTYLETHLKGEVPYLVKIDVEGHEFLALSSGKNYFLKHGSPQHIFTEFSPNFLKRAGSEPVDYLNFLWDLGMTITHNGEKVQRGNKKYHEILDPISNYDIYAYME